MVKTLFTLNPELFQEFLLTLLKRVYFSAKLFDFLALKLMTFALKAINSL
jgi:hypothetical protein